MIRARLALAFLLSVGLIGGAVWLRASNAPSQYESLTAVSNEPLEELPMPSLVAGTSTVPTSTTGLIGRQFFTDYLDLAMNGQATPERVSALAESYAESIATLGVGAPRLSALEVKVVSNGAQEIENYVSSILNIRAKYQNLARMAYKIRPGIDTIESQNYIQTMTAFAALYRASAEELRVLPVPASLVNTHIQLVNDMLTSAEAMQAVANVNTEPALAFSSLKILAENGAKEEETISNLSAMIRQ